MPSSSTPGSDLTGSHLGQQGFYVQAFNELVALPVVGYDYDSLSGLLLSAGLAPAGMIASFAAPTPTSYAARAGLEAVNALTFEVDPSVGAGQICGDGF